MSTVHCVGPGLRGRRGSGRPSTCRGRSGRESRTDGRRGGTCGSGCGHPRPRRKRRRRPGSPSRSPRSVRRDGRPGRHGRVAAAGGFAEVGRALAPDGAVAADCRCDYVDGQAPVVIAQVLRPYRDIQGLRDVDGTVLLDDVAEVHQPGHRERKFRPGHELQHQRKRDHVGIGWRQRVGQPEAADPRVPGQMCAVERDGAD